ncbi:MAG: signal peptidase II [Caldilineaceae bacterium]
MQKLQRIGVLLFVLFVSVGCDQGAKAVAQRYLSPAPRSYVYDLFRLQFAQNNGAFLSLGAILPAQMRFWVFTVLVGLILLGLFIFAIGIAPKSSLTLLIALALILGGGIGNLLDRVLHNGLVVDFMNIGIGPLRTGIFNVADMTLMAGIALLALHEMRRGARAAERSTDNAE